MRLAEAQALPSLPDGREYLAVTSAGGWGRDDDPAKAIRVAKKHSWARTVRKVEITLFDAPVGTRVTSMGTSAWDGDEDPPVKVGTVTWVRRR